MSVLVTGAAGFIGMATAKALLCQGHEVVGIDNFNPYYDVGLKKARVAAIAGLPGFSFYDLDMNNKEGMFELAAKHNNIEYVINLAAQPGVRYSQINPYSYIHSNIDGFMVLLELCRNFPKLKHLVYASSSSVYGANTKRPFAIEDRVDSPISLYAATKKANEMMAYCYSHLYNIPMTGLRYFTVYGPWGRPDMSPYIFAGKILRGEPIQIFNNGNIDIRRDFTYIDDIVAGTIGAMLHYSFADLKPPQRIYNLGNNKVESLLHFIDVLEDSLGKKAIREYLPQQPGDMEQTSADISASVQDFAYSPQTSIEEGIPAFAQWFREYSNSTPK